MDFFLCDWSMQAELPAVTGNASEGAIALADGGPCGCFSPKLIRVPD